MNNPVIKKLILKTCNASSIENSECVQELWSGYGTITRYTLNNSKWPSIIVKHISIPQKIKHPRNWNSDKGHNRKLKSYKVESAWYQFYATQCNNQCRIPHCLAVNKINDDVVIILEDLNTSGFNNRPENITWQEVNSCLHWLANFHATFMNKSPDKLWKVGTYWHLDTRPDELNTLTDTTLKKSAGKIDQMLKKSPFQTLVHGDAKLANFCFSPDGTSVAAVDFQYVGGGCGMKDIAYFIGSCYNEVECEQLENQILDTYFGYLKTALRNNQSPLDLNTLESNWRALYPVAWTDFHRFLKGWSPDHWKLTSYSERLAKETITNL
jgi:hypothetical protein